MTALHLAARRLLLSSFMVFPSVAWAGEDVSVSAVSSANIGYSSNPFSEAGSNTGSGFAQIRVAPEIAMASEKNTLILSGMAQYQRYFEHYGDTYGYDGELDYKGKPSVRLQTHLNLKYDSSIIGQNNYDVNGSSGPVLSGSDLSLFGTRDRRQTSQANGDVNFVLSAHDTLTASAYYVQTRYDSLYAVGDYDGYGGSVGYSRQISARLQLGVQGAASHYTYRFVPGGDTTVYSPQLSFADVLTAYWKLEGAVGASFIDRGTGGHKVSFSGNIDLCHSTTRSDFCLTARRAVLPTGSSGSQNETLAGMRYSYKLSSRDSISTNVDYTKNSGILAFDVLSSSYLRGSAGYRRSLSERIDLTATAKYAHILDNSLNRSADYGGLLGVSVKLGASHDR